LYSEYPRDVPLKLEIFNLLGLKILDKQIIVPYENPINVNITHLDQNLYFLRLYETKMNSFSITLKILKI
jgi:hypothetical protein